MKDTLIRRRVYGYKKASAADDYLTLTPLTNDNYFYFCSSGNGKNGDLWFSTDKNTWTQVDLHQSGNMYPYIVGEVSAGTKIYLKGNLVTDGAGNGIGFFYVLGKYKVSGNIMSLVYGDAYKGKTEFPSTDGYWFAALFKETTNHHNLVDISKLSLPVTTLVKYCYQFMFKNCKNLTSIPAHLLPATRLVSCCYQSMFEGCASLQSIPTGFLPATDFADSNIIENCTYYALSCYQAMFKNCTNLTSVPQDLLPATTIVKLCYAEMFYGCSSLTTAPILPATKFIMNIYYNVANQGCYYRMFYNSGVNNVQMFAPSVTYMQYQAGEYTTTYHTVGWLQNAASTGTIVKSASCTNIPTGSTDGIPSGWTVVNQ